MAELRRWNYDIRYDDNGDVTTAEAVDVTVDDQTETYDVITEHNRYACQLDETGQPLLDETDTPLAA